MGWSGVAAHFLGGSWRFGEPGISRPRAVPAWQIVAGGYRLGMSTRILRLAGAVVMTVALAGCGTDRIGNWELATARQERALRAGGDLYGVTVPVLKAPGLERVWGAPRILRDGEGGYVLVYTDPRRPTSRLMIHGMAAPLPKLSSPPPLRGGGMRNNTLAGDVQEQEWRTVRVLGEKVRWFQQTAGGGVNGAYFSTEGFALKAPNGRKGHYRLVAEHGAGAAEDVGRWFGSVSF
jgi:hypothetical protein